MTWSKYFVAISAKHFINLRLSGQLTLRLLEMTF